MKKRVRMSVMTGGSMVKQVLWVSLAVYVLLAFSSSALGEIIHLKNGTIYFGKPVGASSKGLVFDVFGERVTVAQSDVIKTESDNTALKDQPVEVVLKDDSVIKGRIVDFDEEIGLLVDIEFGTLTIPVVSLKKIVDPVQRDYYSGYPVHLGASVGYSGTVGKLRSDFGGGFNLSLFAEFNTPFFRGIFAGVRASYFIVDYKTDPSLSYSLFTLLPYAMYRVLALQTSSSFLKDLVPYGSLGAGTSFIFVRDKRVGAIRENYGEMNLALSSALGVDYFIAKKILVRLEGGWMLIPQKSSSLNMLSITLEGAYCF